ncbi:MAG: acyl-CoA thioesterase [Myxococcales bacterium]|nr:acyl-CoA thioesterase [Myxococcales bacterium]
MGLLRVPYRVIFGDTDALGIVYYANYLRLLDIGRTEWFRKYSLAPRAMFEEAEYCIVIVETHLEHKRPARFDDELVIELWLNRKWVKNASIRFDYRIYGADGEVCVLGYTRHAFVNRAGVLKRPPRDYLDSLRNQALEREYKDHA